LVQRIDEVDAVFFRESSDEVFPFGAEFGI